MDTLAMDGIFLCGAFKRLEQVKHGANHPKKPNEPVPGCSRSWWGLGRV